MVDSSSTISLTFNKITNLDSTSPYLNNTISIILFNNEDILDETAMG